MKRRKRHGAEQIIRKLRDADAMLAAEKPIGEVCQALEVTKATLHRWRKQYGGKKFLMGDQGYKAFRTWIEDYVKIVTNKYTTAASLPKLDTKHELFGSESWLKLSNTPPAWGDSLVQANVYAWDSSNNAWEAEPVATTDRQNGANQRVFQHTLTLIAAKESDRAATWNRGNPRLPQGKYLVKFYVD